MEGNKPIYFKYKDVDSVYKLELLTKDSTDTDNIFDHLNEKGVEYLSESDFVEVDLEKLEIKNSNSDVVAIVYGKGVNQSQEKSSSSTKEDKEEEDPFSIIPKMFMFALLSSGKDINEILKMNGNMMCIHDGNFVFLANKEKKSFSMSFWSWFKLFFRLKKG